MSFYFVIEVVWAGSVHNSGVLAVVECRDVERFRRLRAYYQELTIPVDEEGAEISSGEIAARYRRALLEVVQAQKKEVTKSRREGGFDYEVTREKEEELDLEEARLFAG